MKMMKLTIINVTAFNYAGKCDVWPPVSSSHHALRIPGLPGIWIQSCYNWW